MPRFAPIHRLVVVFVALLSTSVAGLGAAEAHPPPFVSPVFGDHMVLQRGKPNRFWGWTEPGREVRVEIAGRVASGVAAEDGRWMVRIDPPADAGPHVVRIDGPQSVELRDVLVGDVWLCGGQSNMGIGLLRSQDGAEEAKRADHPRIRFFRVGQQPGYQPAAVLQGG